MSGDDKLGDSQSARFDVCSCNDGTTRSQGGHVALDTSPISGPMRASDRRRAARKQAHIDLGSGGAAGIHKWGVKVTSHETE